MKPAIPSKDDLLAHERKLKAKHPDIVREPAIILDELNPASERVLLACLLCHTWMASVRKLGRVIHHMNDDDAIRLFFYEKSFPLELNRTLWLWSGNVHGVTTAKFWNTVSHWWWSIADTWNTTNVTTGAAIRMFRNLPDNYNEISVCLVQNSWSKSGPATRAINMIVAGCSSNDVTIKLNDISFPAFRWFSL